MSTHWINRLSCRGLVLFQAIICVACPIIVWAGSFADFQAEVVSDLELDSMRGGFLSADGLEISFGVEQAVLIDGILQVATTFNASSITRMLPQQAAEFSSVTMNSDVIRSQMNTIIQNTQDQRIIDSITLINASVTSLGLSRQLNVLQSVTQQQITARQ